MRLRVLTWNIHKAIGGVDRRYRPDRVAEVLHHYQPDLVLLQEVDEGVRRSEFHRQVDLFGEACGFPHRKFGPNVRVRQGRYGNATLSRWPIRNSDNVDLTIPPKKRRGALYTRIRIRRDSGSRTIKVFNLHLGLAGYERKRQLRNFLASQPFARLHQRTPVVVGGDFNDVWGSLGEKLLGPAGFLRAGGLIHTYPAFLPVRPLDGLWVRGDIQPERCFRSRLGLAREASDHLPLVADFRVAFPS